MDIVDRLKESGSYGDSQEGYMALCSEAAIEIECLRKEAQQQSDNYARALQIVSSRDRDICELKQQIENFRKALFDLSEGFAAKIGDWENPELHECYNNAIKFLEENNATN